MSGIVATPASMSGRVRPRHDHGSQWRNTIPRRIVGAVWIVTAAALLGWVYAALSEMTGDALPAAALTLLVPLNVLILLARHGRR